MYYSITENIYILPHFSLKSPTALLLVAVELALALALALAHNCIVRNVSAWLLRRHMRLYYESWGLELRISIL